jgi:hypothetical protein
VAFGPRTDSNPKTVQSGFRENIGSRSYGEI